MERLLLAMEFVVADILEMSSESEARRRRRSRCQDVGGASRAAEAWGDP